MRSRKKGASEQRRLLRQAEALVQSITSMRTLYPLQPVWGGLPSFFPGGEVIKPPEPTEEEKQIHALRDPLSQFLNDAKRFMTDQGISAEQESFRNNELVRVAFQGGNTQRRSYSKQDCIADLQSVNLKGIRAEEHRKELSPLAEQLRAAREASGQSQETAAAEIGIDSQAFAQYERGERHPRKNRAKLITYIGKYIQKR